jgi:hypothetical protein
MSKTVPLVTTKEKRIELANSDGDTEADASQKRKAHLTVGFLEGRIVPGLCAEGLETRSSDSKSRREGFRESRKETL